MYCVGLANSGAMRTGSTVAGAVVFEGDPPDRGDQVETQRKGVAIPRGYDTAVAHHEATASMILSQSG